MQLKRWEKALSSLNLLGGTDNDTLALTLIKQQQLETLGLSLWGGTLSMKREIVWILARRKHKESKYDIALNLFLSTSPPNIEEATNSARSAGDWKAIFSYCCNNDEDKIEALGNAMVEMFSSSGSGSEGRKDKLEAARICVDYCNNDYDNAVRILISGNCYIEADRVNKLNGQNSSVVKNAAKTWASETAVELVERSESLTKYVGRASET